MDSTIYNIVLSAERDSENLKPVRDLHLDEKIGHMPIKIMKIKVSQKGLSTRLVAQTGSTLRIEQRRKAFWAFELEILSQEDLQGWISFWWMERRERRVGRVWIKLCQRKNPGHIWEKEAADPTAGAERLWAVNRGRKCWNAHGVGNGEPQMPRLRNHHWRFTSIAMKPSKQGFSEAECGSLDNLASSDQWGRNWIIERITRSPSMRPWDLSKIGSSEMGRTRKIAMRTRKFSLCQVLGYLLFKCCFI